jgi:hypothetical protein
MQKASLDGFEPIVCMRHRAFQNYVAGIVEKPVAEHFINMTGVKCPGKRIIALSVPAIHRSLSII